MAVNVFLIRILRNPYSLLIYSYIQQIVIEDSLCASHCVRYWGIISSQEAYLEGLSKVHRKLIFHWTWDIIEEVNNPINNYNISNSYAINILVEGKWSKKKNGTWIVRIWQCLFSTVWEKNTNGYTYSSIREMDDMIKPWQLLIWIFLHFNLKLQDHTFHFFIIFCLSKNLNFKYSFPGPLTTWKGHFSELWLTYESKFGCIIWWWNDDRRECLRSGKF